jgi:putative transposase
MMMPPVPCAGEDNRVNGRARPKIGDQALDLGGLFIGTRRIQTRRNELLGRTLVWNQRHLLHAPHRYERHYNAHRPHRGINNARPLHPLPAPITDADVITHLNVHRRDRLGGIIHECEHAA